MIYLIKIPEPAILANNAIHWTKVLEDHKAAGTNPSDDEKRRYNHKDVKSALIIETNSKCAYCESKFDHVTYGDIEHITPKKNDIKLHFDWKNLTIACDKCNTNKGINDDIIDPYSVNPEPLFRSAGPMLLPRPESADAVITERTLKLNRPQLVERRAERIKRIHDLVLLARQNQNERVREAIIIDIKANETLPHQEFAAISRAYIAGLIAEGVI